MLLKGDVAACRLRLANRRFFAAKVFCQRFIHKTSSCSARRRGDTLIKGASVKNFKSGAINANDFSGAAGGVKLSHGLGAVVENRNSYTESGRLSGDGCAGVICARIHHPEFHAEWFILLLERT